MDMPRGETCLILWSMFMCLFTKLLYVRGAMSRLVILLALLLSLSAMAEDSYFFRIDSAQQTSIVDFDSGTGKITWSNHSGHAACTIMATTNLASGIWEPVKPHSSYPVDPSGLAHCTIENITPSNLFFQTVNYGLYSYYGLAQNQVIQSGTQLANTWFPLTPPVLNVDFETETLIITDMGGKPSGGYSIEIVEICQHFDTLTVTYREESPRPGDMVITVMTHPLHAVKIPKTDLNVVFRKIIMPTIIRIRN